MYLSRVALDVRRRETMRALARPTMLHGAIEQSFKGERKRRLWRIDQLDNTHFLLVLSEDQPDFEFLNRQFGNTDGCNGWEIKSYSSFLERIEAKQVWRFRLCANPVHSVKEQGVTGRGKLFAHITREHQKKWLLDRSEKNGFSIQANNFDVIRSEWINFGKGIGKREEISMCAVVYEGVLVVTDATRFCEALVGGIGRGKAYGCGLLTVMRL